MPSLIDIRRRIRSVKNTQQITKAMKMVSAAKLRRAQDRVIAARPYGAMLRKILGNVAAAVAADETVAGNPLLAQRPVDDVGGHDLGQRRGLDALVGLVGREHLPDVEPRDRRARGCGR